jgi:Flp pilus assembly pilin Flp
LGAQSPPLQFAANRRLLAATIIVETSCAIWGGRMLQILRILWTSDEGQDIAEYAVMLATILVLVIGTIRLIGGNANNAFSSVANDLN